MPTNVRGMPGPNTHVQWFFEPGAVRWRRMKTGDATSPRATPGWLRQRHLLDSDPITGDLFPGGKQQWWLREIKL